MKYNGNSCFVDVLLVYEDDNQQLTKNTSVVVKRIPAKGNGLLARINAEIQAA